MSRGRSGKERVKGRGTGSRVRVSCDSGCRVTPRASLSTSSGGARPSRSPPHKTSSTNGLQTWRRGRLISDAIHGVKCGNPAPVRRSSFNGVISRLSTLVRASVPHVPRCRVGLLRNRGSKKLRAFRPPPLTGNRTITSRTAVSTSAGTSPVGRRTTTVSTLRLKEIRARALSTKPTREVGRHCRWSVLAQAFVQIHRGVAGVVLGAPLVS